MEAKYGVSRWPDEKEIFKKMENLVNQPLRHIKPEAMARYMNYFDEKCKGSKAMMRKRKKVIQAACSTTWPSTTVPFSHRKGRRRFTFTILTETAMWTICRQAADSVGFQLRTGQPEGLGSSQRIRPCHRLIPPIRKAAGRKDSRVYAVGGGCIDALPAAQKPIW